MALSSSQPADQGSASNPHSGGGNNYDHLTESPTSHGKDQQDHPETSTRTSKTVEALLNTDAFVLDGEWFYDAVAVEGEDTFATTDKRTGVAYWGLQMDCETQMVYYFNHSQPQEMQWLPPADLIHPATHEVLLWDASAQWFYYYNPQVSKLDAESESSPLTSHLTYCRPRRVDGWMKRLASNSLMNS
ncbi:hypothetical protein L917_08555 [Phytophthora nicotianae]|uniref:Uncharacterized protein n=2 Tax=Phytophthora nicotianae TaxID=4792 RepID=W2Q9G8_PHYN3|nr:hypothetical protein PPTG_11218 [Phytophthora nicotianae INRA-310]ETL93232.1 hypothetical protein L917_08555 [Phytophthora nicotianae]ETM46526.1 hypothetical protein L914_08604 [Phytophthora nicotianae]ETN09204.1 hypothetical protein PPTG_11218 [Phytophthora nicotianae INRA-310]